MCSVIGYIGENFCKEYILQGLTKLEYRGYDSAGFACYDKNLGQLRCIKASGSLDNLVSAVKSTSIDGLVGIGHTRWSTHGISSEVNAHPQFDCYNSISLVHNGIIENYRELKLHLTNHNFLSQTDTEVIAHLLEELLNSTGSLKDALIRLVNTLQGAYAFTVLLRDYPDLLISVRKGSPLCIGIGTNEMFVASDVLAFNQKTNTIIYLPDECVAFIKQNSIEAFNFAGNSITLREQSFDCIDFASEKNGFDHYMLKEIYEQKHAIYSTISWLEERKENWIDQIGLNIQDLCQVDSIILIGCGSSWNAARVAQFFFESVCKMPTRVVLASEYRYMPFFPEKNALYICVSQSGETADTLEVLRLIKSHKLPVIVLSNVSSSTMVREADGYLLTQAGQEIAVASTKAFTTQLAALFWLAHMMGLSQNNIDSSSKQSALDALKLSAEILQSSIEKYKKNISEILAPFYASYQKFIFLGRHISYPFAMEAALKLKEISYIFSQCYPAGELKHGPLALIDAETPIVLFSTLDPLIYQKLVSNAQEVKARNGHLLIFAFEKQYELLELADSIFLIPPVHPLLAPLAMTGVMQFFVYSIAKELKLPIDRPRHLAKSVTVE